MEQIEHLKQRIRNIPNIEGSTTPTHERNKVVMEHDKQVKGTMGPIRNKGKKEGTKSVMAQKEVQAHSRLDPNLNANRRGPLSRVDRLVQGTISKVSDHPKIIYQGESSKQPNLDGTSVKCVTKGGVEIMEVDPRPTSTNKNGEVSTAQVSTPVNQN